MTPTTQQAERAREALAAFGPFVATHTFMQGAWLEALGATSRALAIESAEAKHQTWEAAIEIVLEEVSIAHPKEKEMFACVSRLRARAATSREERNVRD